jgi:hypothetical protein
MACVLINESITDAGLDCLRTAGHQVDIRSGQSDDGETMLMVLATDSSVPGGVLDELRGHQDILSGDCLDLV